MKLYHLGGLFGLLLIVGGVSGCADRGAVSLRQETPSGLAETSDEPAATQPAVVESVESQRSSSPPVQRASAQISAKPSLITLPWGAGSVGEMPTRTPFV